MTIAYVQSASTNGTTSITESVSLTGVGAGNLLVLAIYDSNGSAVSSVLDNQNGLWIRACSANASGSLDNEVWYASGVVGGTTSASVTLVSAPATDFTIFMAEFSGVSSVNAMDQEVPNAGTGTTANAGANVNGAVSGELFISTICTSASVGNASGFTTLSTGHNFDGFSYLIDAGTSNHNPAWNLASSQLWLTNTVSFTTPQYGAPTLNQDFYNFPQIQVEWSPTAAPFAPAWRNVAKYVRSFKTTQGRQHQLDRIEAGSLDITFDNRDGTFNPWNTSSILFNNYQGLQPMNVIRITASWDGITYYVAYQYVQSITPTLKDALNTDATVKCWDILQFLSLRYLSGSNYASLIESDTSLCAYWRCGDSVGSYNKQSSTVVHQLYDSTPSTNTGYGPYPAVLINGPHGYPLLGVPNVLLYDSSTALDLTNNQNTSNGGFQASCPIATQANWSFECWMQYQGPDHGVNIITSAGVTSGSNVLTGVGNTSNIQPGWYVNSDTTIPGNAQVTAVDGSTIYISENATATGTATVTFAPLCTLMTTSTTAGELDIRLGAYTTGTGIGQSVIYNRVLVGIVSGGVFTAYANSTDVIFDSNAQHFAVTVAAGTNSTVVIYIDGVLDSTWIVSGQNFTPSGSTNTVFVGCNSGANNGFAGIMSEVALYGSVLATTEITKHHNQGTWFALSGESGGGTGGEGPSAVGRLNKVLAVAGFPNTQFAIGTSYLTPVYGETSSVTSTTALNMIQIIMETEPGIIFQAQDGNIYAVNRQYVIGHGGAFGLMNSARASTSQGIFGDTAGSTYRYEYNGFDVGQDDLDIWNDVQAKSGRPQLPVPVIQEVNEKTDTTGIAKISGDTYGVRTLQGLTNLLFESDMDALAVAQQYFRWYATGKQRAPSVIIQNTFNQGANNIQMLARTLYDRITVNYQGQTAGSLFTQDGLIESINHDVNVDSGTWKTTFALSPYEISLTQISPGGTGNPPSGQLYSVPAKPIVLGTWTFGDNTAFLLL